MNVVIVGGSPNLILDLKLLEQFTYDLLIGVDRGAYAVINRGIPCDVAVGDFDSLESDQFNTIKLKCKEIVTFDTIKNETDTELAIREAIRRGAKTIHLIGVTGRRLDHFLGTLNLYHRLTIPLYIYDLHNKIYLLEEGTTVITKDHYQYISFFAFGGPVLGLTLDGFKYKLEDYTLENRDSLTISNEILSHEATIYFQKGRLLVIESND